MQSKKHIKLGLAVKSMTNSRTLVNLINRLGHSVSYTSAEEIETELTYYTIMSIFPEDLILFTHLCTGVAFDNYDRFAETLSGSNTLHYTIQ